MGVSIGISDSAEINRLRESIEKSNKLTLIQNTLLLAVSITMMLMMAVQIGLFMAQMK